MVLQNIGLLQKKRIVLASASPRRREILALVGLRNVRVCVSSFAENLEKEKFTCGGEYALRTARKKAECVLQQQLQKNVGGAMPPFDILVAADTVVSMPAPEGGIVIIEKPTTCDEAAEMLCRFSGTRHDLWSGVVLAIYDNDDVLHWRELKVRTGVHFAPLEDEEIAAYVSDSGNWAGKAGGYGIQDTAAALISAIDGDYYNVMGLPLHALCAELDSLIHEGVISGV